MNLPLYNFFAEVPTWAVVDGLLLVALVLGFTGAPLLLWAFAGVAALYGFGAPVWLWGVYGGLVLLFNLPPLRRILSGMLLGAMRGIMPAISTTEQVAIESGTVWVEGELFSGKPDFKRILNEPYPTLTEEEETFLNGPVDELCRITNDWDVFQRRDLSPETWQYLKDERFFGMVVPKAYDGLGFSALMNSSVVQKVQTRSGPLATTVMVPNSLGPAELLTHYGTEAQRQYYLPRLSRGEEIPCFALTEPGAGSDAGAMTSGGVVYRGEDGDLYIRLSWKKRYITLAAISTVLGIAFKLRDPDNLLGQGEHLGITCALIPADAPGVSLGRRHDPLGVPFYNCPTEGHDVEVKLEDAVIGGMEGVGNGWRMLMESLAAGRGISLPASAAGGAKGVFRVASAHATVRKQFGMSIGKFEGIEEPLAQIGGWNYLMEAARIYTCGALMQGGKPAVVTAMMKYNMTELGRLIVNHGMDILAGNAISRGPKNLIAHGYISTPISITVEGANILTRTLMIFGQGAIRCHPYAFKEIQAIADGNVKAFDAAFWPHIGHVVRNATRSVVLSVTRGRLSSSPIGGPSARYIRRLNWASATFAFLADVAMGTLGGDLKRKEMLTGRYADVFSWMYLAAATIRRFEAEGRRKEDEPFFDWSMQYALSQIQEGFEGLYKNLQVPGLTWLMRGPIGWWVRLNTIGTFPSDRLTHKVARLMQVPGEQRDRMTDGIYMPTDLSEPAAFLEHAFVLSYQADGVVRKLKDAMKARTLPKARPEALVKDAVAKGIITAEEAKLLQRAEAARQEAIQVDEFTLEDYKRSAVVPESATGDGAAAGDGATISPSPATP